MNRVKYETTTTGTGALTVSSVTGFQGTGDALYHSFGSSRFHYVLLDANETDWEHGLGSLSGSTLTRQTVLESTNTNSAISLSAGTHTVLVTKAGMEGMIIAASCYVTAPASISANSTQNPTFNAALDDGLAALGVSGVTSLASELPFSTWSAPLENLPNGLGRAWRATMIVGDTGDATAGHFGCEIGSYFNDPKAAAWAPYINGTATYCSCTTPWLGLPQADGTATDLFLDDIAPKIYNDSSVARTMSKIELYVEFLL